ncbi:MAG: hypothetical protein IJ846_05435 [Alphaproteobacteria bacterium]|nr:hypothetical protein [Alphaproteobacteria bacterium]
MNRLFKKHLWLAALVISTAPAAYADDLFDDSFFAEPAPVDAVKPAADVPAPEQSAAAAPAPAPKEPATQETPAIPEPAAPSIEAPLPPTTTEPQTNTDFPAMSMDLNVPPPPSDPVPAPTSISGFDFGTSGAGAMNLSTPPSEQILGKISSDVFREMAEMERENNALMLQLKREQLRSEIDALKTSNRQMLFDEIERREKMTQARLEWELAQDLKRQEALERKQKADIRQKQIEAALKREEDRRIQKMKDEEAARIQKEKEEKAEIERRQEALKRKYNAVSMIQVNGLKPTLLAATRPAKIKRSASSRVPAQLTSIGEDLLSKKKAGEALTTEISGEEKEEVKREPATALYSVSEIRGTAGTLIAKLISKKDRTTFFVKKSTILPTGHTVINIDKDFVMVQIGKDKEMIGFPSAGLISEGGHATPAESASQETGSEPQRPPRRSNPVMMPNKRTSTPMLSAVSISEGH